MSEFTERVTSSSLDAPTTRRPSQRALTSAPTRHVQPALEAPTYLPAKPRARSVPAPAGLGAPAPAVRRESSSDSKPTAHVVERRRSAPDMRPRSRVDVDTEAASRAAPRVDATPPPAPAPAPRERARTAAPTPPPPQPSSSPSPDPVPPELAPAVYGLIRRLALQSSLPTADKVLRAGVAELTGVLDVVVVYAAGADRPWSIGGDDELPDDLDRVLDIARGGAPVFRGRNAVVPIVAGATTVAVIVANRGPRQPDLGPVEHVALASVARECAGIFHNLVLEHVQLALERKAAAGGLYRQEALESHRNKNQDGAPMSLSPHWVKRAYPTLVILVVASLSFALWVDVPTYSSGSGVVVFDGTKVTAPTPGTVEAVLVESGQEVKAGEVLVRLHSAEELAELEQASTELENALTQFLFDGGDDVKAVLANAVAREERTRARVETRVVRAAGDGVVSDIRVQLGMLLTAGDHILTLVAPGAEPEVIAFLPGTDRPRIRPGMTLQIGLTGYVKVRDKAKIVEVGTEVIGPQEARRYIGNQIADALKLNGSQVIVRARLPKRTFSTQRHTYHYHHGMLAKTECKIESKPFLVTLIPAIEKVLY
jgi:membrane fusion protein (multidrug efflux system)